MIFRSLLDGDLRGLIISLCLTLPAVLICLTVHECAHGLTARLLGDHTAERAGRLTLDPMAHIDPMGFLCMVLFGFGWARPVPVNVSGFRIRNRKLGMALVGLAGPLSNFILAVPCFMAGIALTQIRSDAMFWVTLQMFVMQIGTLSVGLGMFNLIPLHPLDGSHILDLFLPFSWQVKLQKYQGVLLLAVILIVYFGVLDIFIGGATNALLNLAMRLVRPLL